MRTKAKIVGIGERKSGVSKKGKKYDFTPFHLIFEDRDTEGLAAACTLVDQSILDAIPLPKINDEVEIFFHFYNGNMTIDGICVCEF